MYSYRSTLLLVLTHLSCISVPITLRFSKNCAQQAYDAFLKALNSNLESENDRTILMYEKQYSFGDPQFFNRFCYQYSGPEINHCWKTALRGARIVDSGQGGIFEHDYEQHDFLPGTSSMPVSTTLMTPSSILHRGTDET